MISEIRALLQMCAFGVFLVAVWNWWNAPQQALVCAVLFVGICILTLGVRDAD